MNAAIPRDVTKKDDGTHFRREMTQDDIAELEEYYRQCMFYYFVSKNHF